MPQQTKHLIGQWQYIYAVTDIGGNFGPTVMMVDWSQGRITQNGNNISFQEKISRLYVLS